MIAHAGKSATSSALRSGIGTFDLHPNPDHVPPQSPRPDASTYRAAERAGKPGARAQQILSTPGSAFRCDDLRRRPCFSTRELPPVRSASRTLSKTCLPKRQSSKRPERSDVAQAGTGSVECFFRTCCHTSPQTLTNLERADLRRLYSSGLTNAGQ